MTMSAISGPGDQRPIDWCTAVECTVCRWHRIPEPVAPPDIGILESDLAHIHLRGVVGTEHECLHPSMGAVCSEGSPPRPSRSPGRFQFGLRLREDESEGLSPRRATRCCRLAAPEETHDTATGRAAVRPASDCRLPRRAPRGRSEPATACAHLTARRHDPAHRWHPLSSTPDGSRMWGETPTGCSIRRL